MYRYADPGKPYGFGRYGGLDATEWCPPADTAETFTPVVAAGMFWIVEPDDTEGFQPAPSPLPPVPCED